MSVTVKVWSKTAYEEGRDPKKEQELYNVNVLRTASASVEDHIIEVDYENDNRAASFNLRVLELGLDLKTTNTDRWNKIRRNKKREIKKNDPDWDYVERVTLHKNDYLEVEDVVVLQIDNMGQIESKETRQKANITKIRETLDTN